MRGLGAVLLLLTVAPTRGQERDDHGDPLPPGAVARLGTIRWKTPGRVTDMAWSPDGARMVAVGDDWVSVFDARGRPLRSVQRAGAVHSGASWSPDGKSVAVGSGRLPVMSFDPASGEVRELGLRGTRVAWSPDGGMLAAWSPETLSFWAPEGPAPRPVPDLADVRGLAWSPDGKRLALVSGERLCILDPFGGTVQLEREGCAGSVAWSARGVLATGPWALTAEEEERDEPPPPSLRLLGADGKELSRLELGDDGYGAQSLAFSPDDKVVAVTNQLGVRLLDVGSARVMADFPLQRAEGADFSPDGTQLLVRHAGGLRQVLLRPSPGLAPVPGHPDGVKQIEWLPDGKRVVTVGDPGGQALVWSLGGDKPRPFVGAGREVSALALSRDGALRAIVSNAARELVIERTDGSVLRRIRASQPSLVTFSPDGTRLVRDGLDRLEVWDVEGDGEWPRHALEGGGGGAHAWSEDGKRLVVYDHQCTMSVWDLSGAQPARVSQVPFPGTTGATGVVFLPGAERYVACSGAVCVIMTAAGEEAQKLEAKGSVRGVVVSRDGKRLALVHYDGVSVLDADTLAPRCSFRGHHLGYVHAASFSPDGKLVATGAEDGTALVWPLPE